MVVLFVNENDFCYYINCLYNHKYKFSSEKEQVNESQYIVSRPDSGRLRDVGVTSLVVSKQRFRRFWKSLCLGESR